MRTVLALLLVAACSKSEPAQPAPDPAKVAARASKDPVTAKDMIAKGAVVIDVRTPEEYSGEHLPQATNIPLQDLPQRMAEVEKLVGGDKSKPVVLHCAKGGRAGKAKDELEKLGYTNVVNGGGYDDLK